MMVKESIKSKAYRLLKPQIIGEVILEHAIEEGHVVVEPELASICHADLRYFTGQRRPEALAKKLPMSLLHEGVGRVTLSRSPEIQVGQRVAIVPNIPDYLLRGISSEECCPACKSGIGDNYCYNGRFLGSGTDGIAQSRLVIPAACAIPIPEEVPDEIAVLAELCSVSHQAVHHVKHRLSTARTAVFGDGPVGYLTAAVLHHVFKLGVERLQVFGAIDEKLNYFTFADRALVQTYDFRAGPKVDIAIECTGGRFSESAINQAIDILKPGGVLILMGVSEERVPINTRDILEKGITLIGSSRSSYKDFQSVLTAMRDQAFQMTLSRLLPEQRETITSVGDFIQSMEHAASHRDWKKTVLDLRWDE